MFRSYKLALLLTLSLAISGQGFRLDRQSRRSGDSKDVERKNTAAEAWKGARHEVDHTAEHKAQDAADVSLAQQEVVGEATLGGSTGTFFLCAVIILALAGAVIYALKYRANGATTGTPYPQTPDQTAPTDSDANVCLDPDDHTDVVTMHERQSRRRTTTIFKESLEEEIEQTNSRMHVFLNSMSGIGLQGMLCFAMVSINVYEAIMKKKARQASSFDYTSVVIFQGFFSVVLAFLIAVYTGKLNDMFNKETLWKLTLYSPVGCLFSLTAYLTFVIFEYLAVDVFKILEQGRLLVTAVLMMAVFGKKQSLSAWCALVVITFAAISYGQISQLQTALAGGGSKSNESKNFLVGLMLTGVFILVNCSASVYSELMLKTDHHLPFFIKKFYFEVPGTLFGLLLSWQLNPLLIATGWKKPDKVSFFGDGPFAGWNNHWVILCVTLFIVKSWVTGYLVQQMSSLVKQLCSVSSVGVLYFFSLVHLKCSHVDTFFCPEKFSSEISVSMVVADFCVLCAVISYTLAQRDKSRKTMYKEQVDQAKSENEQLKGTAAKI